MLELFFDVETKKFFSDIDSRDPGKLGVSVVSAYRREVDRYNQERSGEMASFFEKDFDAMWPWFEKADRIIGFNSKGFDVPALAVYYNRGIFASLPHFDILEEVRREFGRRIGLDAIAKETLGNISKLATGFDAVAWWEKGDEVSLSKLARYCEMDVEVTKRIYDYGKQNGKLKFKDRWNEPREVKVDFGYAKAKQLLEKQMGLFG